MTFSIIVPMYNVEEYIDRCLDSLTKQDCDDYEIIVIDDKSTDHSLELAKRWADKYHFISVVRKDYNSGLSETRNYGLNRAKGDYIIFVDSDDYVEENCLSEIAEELIKYQYPDIMYMAFYEETLGGVTVYRDLYASNHGINLNANEFMLNELKQRQLYASVCTAVYKRELILSNRLFFRPGICHEDELWSPMILGAASKVCHVDLAYYHYVKRPNSITTAKDQTRNELDLLSVCHELMEKSSEYDDAELCKWMRNHIAILYMKATAVGILYRHNYRDEIDRTFPIRNVCTAYDTTKALLFFLNPSIYGLIYRIVTKLKPVLHK